MTTRCWTGTASAAHTWRGNDASKRTSLHWTAGNSLSPLSPARVLHARGGRGRGEGEFPTNSVCREPPSPDALRASTSPARGDVKHPRRRALIVIGTCRLRCAFV